MVRGEKIVDVVCTVLLLWSSMVCGPVAVYYELIDRLSANQPEGNPRQ